jgi:hypothetical protein
MQDVTKLPYQLWALIWVVLAFWMSAMGVFIVLETHDKDQGDKCSDGNLVESFQEAHPLTTELT